MALDGNAATFYVRNLGCRVNRVEADSIAASLLEAGVARAAEDEASVVIVNSCTVTAEADAKTRKAVRHALEGNRRARVVVTGCAAYIDPDAMRALGDRVIVEPDKSKVAGIVCDVLGIANPSESGESGFTRGGEDFMVRAGIKVQDGCDNRCTFCIVNRARGPLWSKPLDDVIDEVVRAEKAGLSEVVLTGVNLGRYAGGCSLPALIAKILGGTERVRVRLSSIEPPDVDDELIELLATSGGRVCRFLHMPLQSGCEKTLHEMGRLYGADDFRNLVERLYRDVPGIALSTDVIAGFPGETDADFEESFALCRDAAFSKMHVFRYSMRPGTPAAERTDQVDPQVKNERARRLRELSDEMRDAFAFGLVGKAEKVCIMDGNHGMSERYLEAVIEGDRIWERGELVDVAVADWRDGHLVCRVS